jgi:CcmD family protein
MTDMQWLLGTGVAVWLGLGVYVTFLFCVQNNLERRVRRLEAPRDE